MAQQPQLLIVVSGPESCGKSTLAEQLAQQLHAPLVEEQARAYLEARPVGARGYTSKDVLNIAQAQANAEAAALATGAPLVIADTDQQVLRLWWLEKYGDLPVALQEPVETPESRTNKIRRHYLLCYPDLAWEPDPLRENPKDRLRLFQRQLAMLQSDQALFRVIWGQGAARERRAWQYVKALLEQ